jgi:hypothetical protein
LICFFLGSISTSGQQPNISEKLTTALKQGDAHALSDLFAPYIMIHIQDFQKVVNAQQARMQLSDFFKQHPSSGLTLTKSENEENQEYFIWNYISGNEKWRVYVLLKSEKGQKLIQQIDIEKTP